MEIDCPYAILLVFSSSQSTWILLSVTFFSWVLHQPCSLNPSQRTLFSVIAWSGLSYVSQKRFLCICRSSCCLRPCRVPSVVIIAVFIYRQHMQDHTCCMICSTRIRLVLRAQSCPSMSQQALQRPDSSVITNSPTYTITLSRLHFSGR